MTHHRALATPEEIRDGIDTYLEKRIKEELRDAAQQAKNYGNAVGHQNLMVATRAPMDTDQERQTALAWLEIAARIHNFSSASDGREKAHVCRELVAIAQSEWNLLKQENA